LEDKRGKKKTGNPGREGEGKVKRGKDFKEKSWGGDYRGKGEKEKGRPWDTALDIKRPCRANRHGGKPTPEENLTE